MARIIAGLLVLSLSLIYHWQVLAPDANAQPADTFDDYASPGSYQTASVDALRLPATDSAPAVSVRIHYPQGEGPFPLIVFSHGLGGSKDSFAPVTSHWASHGYVVVQPSHDDSGVGFRDGGMHPPMEKVRERLANITTVLDGLETLQSLVPSLAGRIDADRIAVAGHSYGSFITLLAGGASIDDGDTENLSLAYPGLRCILPISPSGRGDYGLNDDSFKALSLPMMVITGTRDQRNGRPDDWRMEPYHLSPAGAKYLLVIRDAEHGHFGGDAVSDAPDMVRPATTAFWDACLLQKQAGLAYLNSPEGFRRDAGERASFEIR